MTVVVIKSDPDFVQMKFDYKIEDPDYKDDPCNRDYLLETPRISKYSSTSWRKVKIFDRCGQSAGNPLKISDILEGGKLLQ